jgi:hypothetical protein
MSAAMIIAMIRFYKFIATIKLKKDIFLKTMFINEKK